jgi:hypothetical protein
VLPTHYFHVVFSVPHELNVFALENPRAFYDLLFTASAAAALEMAANPERLGAEIGLIAILHTWGQNLLNLPSANAVRVGTGASAARLFEWGPSATSGVESRGRKPTVLCLHDLLWSHSSEEACTAGFFASG